MCPTGLVDNQNCHQQKTFDLPIAVYQCEGTPVASGQTGVCHNATDNLQTRGLWACVPLDMWTIYNFHKQNIFDLPVAESVSQVMRQLEPI